jgi:hypothetical protein
VETPDRADSGLVETEIKKNNNERINKTERPILERVETAEEDQRHSLGQLIGRLVHLFFIVV